MTDENKITLQERAVRELWVELFENEFNEKLREAVATVAENNYTDDVPIVISYEELKDIDEDLASDLLIVPEKAVRAGKNAAEIVSEDDISKHDVEIRFTGVPVTEVRDVTHKHLGKLIAIEGIVQQETDPQPRFTEMAYECLRCGHITTVRQTQNHQQDPYQCPGCEREGPWRVDTTQSTYIQQQRVRVQESPEKLRGGEDPRSFDVYLEGSLVDAVKPGDNVTATGILRHPDPTDESGDSPLVDTYIDANNVLSNDASASISGVTDEEIEEIKKLVNEMDNPIQGVVDSIAPSVYGYDDIKLAVALQMFSGVRKPVADKTIRGNLHVMLVGDPGTAKSQVLQYVSNTIPRGTYSTGEGSSKVGLTAAAVQSDLGDGGWTVEAGALVMSDNGIAAVDEIDKLDENGLNAFHTALEQQEVNVAKAGINTTLNARTGVLAAANPKYGRWDEYEPVPEQLDLPPALISRFDLIFTVRDKPNEEFDSRLADSVLETSRAGERVAGGEDPEDVSEMKTPVIPGDLLPKYITYTRDEFHPVLTREAQKKLKEFYVGMRSQGADSESAIPVTARKLEALVRIAEASARIRLSEEVSASDAELAIEIVNTSLEQVGVDPETGEYDADMLETGTSQSQRERIKSLTALIDALDEDYDNGVPKEELREEAKQNGIDMSRFDHEIQKLKQRGEIYEPQSEHYRLT